MGVTGLWQILQSTGRPVTLESLEGKVLAVDVSIWLNQLVKGMRDRHGNPVPNAHLVGLYTRVCKLLFYKIKPVFVFDGGVPVLKKQTLASRKQRKEEAAESSNKATEKILNNLIRQQAIKKSLQPSSSAVELNTIPVTTTTPRDDMFILPPVSQANTSTIEEEDEDVDFWEERMNERQKIYNEYQNVENVDIESEEFKEMPPEIRHEILTELKDQRKQNHWANLDDLPEDSDDFSSYQVAKLLKQSKLSAKLDQVSKEINARHAGSVTSDFGGHSSDLVEMKRVVSEDTAHYVLIKGLSQNKKTSLRDNIVKKESSSEDNKNFKSMKSDKTSSAGNWLKEDFSCVVGSSYSSCYKSELFDEPKPSTSGVSVHKSNNESQPLISRENVSNFSEYDEPQPSTSGIDVKVSNDTSQPSSSHGDVFNNVEYDEPQPSTSFQNHTDTKVDIPIFVNSSDEESDNLITDIKKLKKIQASSKKIKTEKADDLAFISNGDKEAICLDSDSNEEAPFLEKNSDVVEIDYDHEGGFIKEENDAEEVQSKKDVTMETSNPDFAENKSLTPQVKLSFKQEKLTDQHKESQLTESQNSQQQTVSLQDTDEESSDDDFIEITLDPNNIKPDDELFPASIFQIAKKQSKSPDVQQRLHSSNTYAIVENSHEQPIKDDVIDIIEDNVSEANQSDEESRRDDEVIIERPNEFIGMTQDELASMQNALEQQQRQLEQERGRQERLATTITDQMYTEAQELLSLFGIPYVISPMEAEAQCAFLDATNQIEGTITDDSDIWLFGGKRVYKNFFNQNKEVELFRVEDIKCALGLDRRKLINIALLCGSDYTCGIQGVGPISALEILAEFRGEEPLVKFRDWWNKSQKQVKIPQETKVKSKLRKLQLLSGFPSPAVEEAYMEPCVDESRDSFTWGKPDVDTIRQYAIDKFGWVKTKTDETLLPVMKQLESREHQASIKKFFVSQPSEKRNIKSKRMQRALDQFSHQPAAESSLPAQPISNEELKERAKQVLNRAKNKADDVITKQNGKDKKPVSRRGKRVPAVGRKRASRQELPKEMNLSESSSTDSSEDESPRRSQCIVKKPKYQKPSGISEANVIKGKQKK